ncbi:LacI family DNA-binding transcriptional regulator [Dactylosporangium sp. CA-152071]|uniref:LacI family DNA-binding transcriptional regulator n=1 Tax=Dactylosporangium sp. CA-152071 TaxID=3239933 RepID=UPI003D8AC245
MAMAAAAHRHGIVSRVVNDAPHVQPELAERVLAAVAELGFRRNHLAGSPSTTSTWPAWCRTR